jgi:hypothetical protein
VPVVRYRDRMRGVLSVLAACVIALLASVPAHRGHAQPAPTNIDLERARVEYTAAETAMTDGDFNLATNHYANSYRASNDPALLYKIGVARQKAGDCLNAVRLYWTFLQLGKPGDDHATLTRERIRKCGGDADHEPGPPPADPVAGWGFTVPAPGSGSAEPTPGSGSGSAIAGSGSAEPAGSGSAVEPAGSGSAVPPPPKSIKGKHRAAWLLVGGAVAAVTAGAVLAYSSSAAEKDVEDLYVGLGGTPPRFDANTRKRFDDLVAEGNRYEKLSWVSFGVAAALGGVATWRFLTDKKSTVEVTPSASPAGAGVRATLRW